MFINFSTCECVIQNVALCLYNFSLLTNCSHQSFFFSEYNSIACVVAVAVVFVRVRGRTRSRLFRFTRRSASSVFNSTR